MIPLRDANPTWNVPWITYALIVANALVFLLWQPLTGGAAAQQGFFYCHAEVPWEVTNGANLADGGASAREALDRSLGAGAGEVIQGYVRSTCPSKSPYLAIFVSMFLHGGWLHILGNMLYLWIFGNNVEDRLGRFAFVGFYLLGGLAAAGLQLFFDPSAVVPSVGASGAIGAVLGAYLVLFPGARVTTLVTFIFISVVQLPAGVVLGGWFVLQLLQGVGSLGVEVGGGVAYWAHVGGFAFGAAAAYVLFGARRGPALPRPPD